MTVGTPSFLFPPSGFGISTRLTAFGLYFPFLSAPSNSSRCSFRYGSISSTVIPSIPAEPPFLFTFRYALFRLLLSSIASSKFSAPSCLSVSSRAMLHTPLLLSVSNIPSQGQPTFAVFCGLCIAPPYFRFQDYYCSVLCEKNFFPLL